MLSMRCKNENKHLFQSGKWKIESICGGFVFFFYFSAGQKSHNPNVALEFNCFIFFFPLRIRFMCECVKHKRIRDEDFHCFLSK